MKALGALLLLAWFGAWTGAGYRMTMDSFAWTDKPGWGLSPQGTVPRPRLDMEKVKAAAPKPGQDLNEWFSALPEAKKRCLIAAVGAERAAELTGGAKPTPEETIRLLECLQ